MRPATCSRRTKFIARVMAFVWLLSLAVSAAHACVLMQSQASTLMAHHAAEHDAGQQACKAFCDSEPSTLAKTKLADTADTLPVLAPMGAWRLQPAVSADADWRLTAAAPPPGIALAILFLRLTL